MDINELTSIAKDEIDMITKVLPTMIREQASSCFISYEEKPELDGIIDEDILGCFEGSSLIDEPDPSALPRIRIFLGNIWDYCDQDTEDYRDEVGTTYLHELGHYLGWEEDDLEARGLD